MKPAPIRVTVLLAAALALVVPAAGKTGSKAASKLSTAVKGALKDHKALLKNLYGLLDLQVKVVEKNTQLSGFSDELRTDLFDALVQFQQGMREATDAAQASVAQAAQAALATFAGSGSLDGQFPAGFHPGDGGKLDSLRRGLGQQDANQYRRLDKRLGKLRKLVEKQAGVALGFVLLPPVPVAALSFSESVSQVEDARAGVDTLVAVGRPDTDGDGLVLAAGNGHEGKDITVTATSASGGGPFTADVPSGGGTGHRWSFVFDGGGDGLAEGLWRISAALSGDIDAELRVIGVR